MAARVFVPPERLGGAQVILEGEAFRHLARVLRAGVGDEIVVFDGRGTAIDARVLSVGRGTMALALGARQTVPAAAVEIALLQVVPRGERMDLIVQKTTELGVARIVPVLTGRSVARPSADRSRRWQTIATEAARQCGRADVPEVAAPLPLAEALAAADQGTGTARFVLWEEERERPLRRVLDGAARAAALLVGPEGGLDRSDVALAQAAGFLPVGLGPRILRAETAAIIAVALTQAAGGGLD